MEGGRAPAVASMRAAGWLTGFLPSPSSSASGTRLLPSFSLEVCSMSTTRAHALTDLKKKKSRRRRRARALYSPLKASLCVSRSQAASSFSITKGGGEERGEEDKIKGGGDELKLRQLDERSGRKGRSKTKMEDHIQHSVGWI